MLWVSQKYKLHVVVTNGTGSNEVLLNMNFRSLDKSSCSTAYTLLIPLD